jgi:hypothetical protein
MANSSASNSPASAAMARILNNNQVINTSKARKASAYDGYSAMKQARTNGNIKYEADPTGFVVVTETLQKAVMYLGVLPPIIKQKFGIGMKVSHQTMINLRARRTLFRTNDPSRDVAPGHLLHALISCAVPLPCDVMSITSEQALNLFESLADQMCEDPNNRGEVMEPWHVYNLFMDHDIEPSESLKLSKKQYFNLKAELELEKNVHVPADNNALNASLLDMFTLPTTTDALTLTGNDGGVPLTPITPAKTPKSKAKA